MAEKEVKAAAPAEMIPADTVLTMLKIAIEEARKPPVDPMKEKQKARARERNKQAEADMLKFKIAKFRNCSHMQRPGSILTGCSAVAWATQSDGIVRGPCQSCGTLFSPIKEECICDEVHEAYKFLIRIPTHPAGDMAWTHQHA